MCLVGFHLLPWTRNWLLSLYGLMSTLGRRALKGYLTACATQILHTTHSRLPHSALHSPSYIHLHSFFVHSKCEEGACRTALILWSTHKLVRETLKLDSLSTAAVEKPNGMAVISFQWVQCWTDQWWNLIGENSHWPIACNACKWSKRLLSDRVQAGSSYQTNLLSIAPSLIEITCTYRCGDPWVPKKGHTHNWDEPEEVLH